MNIKKIVAREWIYLLISLCISLIALPFIISIFTSLINPIDRVTKEKSYAWWNIYSQSELEDFQDAEPFSSIEKDIRKKIQRWIYEVESDIEFLDLVMSEKNRHRLKYLREAIEPKLLLRNEIENAKKAFFKPIMEKDKLWLEKNKKYVEPKNPESLYQSRERWKKMWLSVEPEILKTNKIKNFFESFAKRYSEIYSNLIEGIEDSFLGVLILILFPYFVFQFIRSIRWAIKWRK